MLKNPPDIMEFFTSDLQKESASFSLVGVQTLHNDGQVMERKRAFDIYRHIRAWEQL